MGARAVTACSFRSGSIRDCALGKRGLDIGGEGQDVEIMQDLQSYPRRFYTLTMSLR